MIIPSFNICIAPNNIWNSLMYLGTCLCPTLKSKCLEGRIPLVLLAPASQRLRPGQAARGALALRRWRNGWACVPFCSSSSIPSLGLCNHFLFWLLWALYKSGRLFSYSVMYLDSGGVVLTSPALLHTPEDKDWALLRLQFLVSSRSSHCAECCLDIC